MRAKVLHIKRKIDDPPESFVSLKRFMKSFVGIICVGLGWGRLWGLVMRYAEGRTSLSSREVE